ncbi:MAG: N-6 DNA methylase, partial [Planctomycetaceae bacterium]
MPKESFQHPESQQLFQLVEEVSQRAGVSRGQAFEDFLHCTVCALGHPLMEPEYLQTVERHKEGTKGRRSVDTIAQAFATLVDIMDRTGADILGDVFQGAITYGERGQFMTPESVCRMMAQLSLPEGPTDLDGRRTVCDPCCGSGRMLMAAAEMQPHWQFVG